MELKIEEHDGVLVVALSGRCSIYEVSALKQELSEAMRRNLPIALETANVVDIDTAGLQLFTVLKSECVARNLPFTITNCSPAMMSALDLLGLASFFEDAGEVLSASPSRPGSTRGT